MWLITPHGMFSAVQHRDNPDLLVVRERVYADAERLRTWYQDWLDGLATAAGSDLDLPDLPLADITVYEHSDYPWRVIMPRTAWAAFLAEAAEDIDYGNFKDQVKATQGEDRAHVYARVWAVLLSLEYSDPDGRSTGEDNPVDCPRCEGSGRIDTSPAAALRAPWLETDADCPVCDGTGEVTQVEADEWHAEAEDRDYL